MTSKCIMYDDVSDVQYYSIFIIQYIFFFYFCKHNYSNIATWVIKKLSENECISENYECAFFDKGAEEMLLQ